MARELVDDELWEIVRPLLPPPPPHKSPAGRKRLVWLHQFRRLRVSYERRADMMKVSSDWAVPSFAGGRYAGRYTIHSHFVRRSKC